MVRGSLLETLKHLWPPGPPKTQPRSALRNHISFLFTMLDDKQKQSK